MAGIPRSRGDLVPVRVSGRSDPVAMVKDIAALATAVREMQYRLNLVDDKLSRRVNEMLLSGPLASRPAPGIQDRIYWATDGGPSARLYYDDGTNWISP
jgi:hypothetical protein